MSATIAPAMKGKANVSAPKSADFLRARANSAMSISKPARNMSNSLPKSEKNSTTAPCGCNTPKTCGPSRTPARMNPIGPGSRSLCISRGSVSVSTRHKANAVSGGSRSARFMPIYILLVNSSCSRNLRRIVSQYFTRAAFCLLCALHGNEKSDKVIYPIHNESDPANPLCRATETQMKK